MGQRMAVQAHTPRFLDLVAEDAEVEQLGTGFTFTEGPLWHPDGYLLFSDMPGDVRRRWTEQEGVTEVANPSNKGNGMTWDLDGRLLVCEHVTSSLVRMDPDGTGSGREVLATHYDGRELNSPNDVVVKSDGTIYFTDPTYGRMPGFGIERDQDLDFQGVYRLPPGGSGDALELVVDDFAQPNGLCFTADERTLYINDTDRAHIRVFDVQEDGSLTGGDVLAENIGTGDLETGELVDGMKLDEHGNIWVTGPKGVWVFSPEGEHLGVVEVPENVGNINWGGPDWSWLFIPASTSMYRVQTKVSGNRLSYMR
jgi:gluconolactonase